MNIGKVFEYIRFKHGLTIREAGAKLNIAHSHWINIENNETNPSIKLLEQFELVFGINAAVLEWCLRDHINGLSVDLEKLRKQLREEL